MLVVRWVVLHIWLEKWVMNADLPPCFLLKRLGWSSAGVGRQDYLVCLLRTKKRVQFNKQMCYMSWNWVGVLHISVLLHLDARAFSSCLINELTQLWFRLFAPDSLIYIYIIKKFCRRAIRGLGISNVPNLIFSIIKRTFNAFRPELLICWYGLGGLNQILLLWNHCLQAVLTSCKIHGKLSCGYPLAGSSGDWRDYFTCCLFFRC